MIDEFLEVGVDFGARLVGPDELFGGVEDEGELIHLSLVKLACDRVDVGSEDPHVPGGAAQPLPSVFFPHVLAFHIYLRLDWPRLGHGRRRWGRLGFVCDCFGGVLFFDFCLLG